MCFSIEEINPNKIDAKLGQFKKFQRLAWGKLFNAQNGIGYKRSVDNSVRY